MIAVDVLQEWVKNSLDNMPPQQLECIFDVACNVEAHGCASVHHFAPSSMTLMLWKNIRKNFQEHPRKDVLISPTSKYRVPQQFFNSFRMSD